MSKAWSFIRRDFLMATSYRTAFAINLLMVVAMVPVLYYAGQGIAPGHSENFARYGGSYFSFLLIGWGLLGFHTISLTTFNKSIRDSQMMGTLETVLLSPTSVTQLVVYSSLWIYVFVTIRFALFLGLGVLFGLDLGQGNGLSALVVLAMSVPAFSALGIASAAIVVVIKRGDAVNPLLTTGSLILGGIMFPVSAMPEWLQVASRLLPITHALEAMRLALFQGATLAELWPQLGVLMVFVLVLLPLSLLAFWGAVRWSKASGTLAEVLMQPTLGQQARPRHFGPVSSPLFGCYHPPQGTALHSGIVVCPPFGQEFVRAHRALRLLATRLAARGFPVLRLDYHGCGDSAGDDGAGDLTRWQGDIEHAVDALQELSGEAGGVNIVGLRLGGSLAARVAAARADVERLVLWEPIVWGSEYLREMTAAHAEWEGSLGRLRAPVATGQEILGFVVSERLRTDLEELDLTAAPPPHAQQILVVEEGREAERAGLLDRLSSGSAAVTHVQAEGAALVMAHNQLELMWVPNRAIEDIAAWFVGGRS